MIDEDFGNVEALSENRIDCAVSDATRRDGAQ